MAKVETKAFSIRELPIDTRLKIKGIALKKNITLNKAAITALTEYAEREGGK